MGYPHTVWGDSADGLTPAQQREMTGSAFDYVHMWFILRQIIPPSELYATPIAAPLVWDLAQLWQWERFIRAMDGPTRRDHFREM